jgi:class 3 adenylate cyclase
MSPEGGALPETPDPAALPTGEVTFLFSDIEGSTQRWDADAEAMKFAVARHEQLVGSAITRHSGYVFKSMGDGRVVGRSSDRRSAEGLTPRARFRFLLSTDCL